MAEATQPATPPAASGGNDELAKQIATLQQQIAQMEKNQKVLGDTLIAQKPVSLEEVQKLIDAAPKGLSAEEAKKLLADEAAAARAQADAAAKKTSARQAVIDAKLKGVPEEFVSKLPDTDNADDLAKAADAIAARWNEVAKAKAPDVGGAGKDGGTPPGQQGGATAPVFSGLPDGIAKLASETKMPSAAPAAAAEKK